MHASTSVLKVGGKNSKLFFAKKCCPYMQMCVLLLFRYCKHKTILTQHNSKHPRECAWGKGTTLTQHNSEQHPFPVSVLRERGGGGVMKER